MTQVELAEIAGTSQPYLNRIEMGKQIPSAKVIVAAANAFGCSTDELLKEE
nr:MAG TPA: Helix-turn-helix XRE-family like protein [Caudoviricetes sp.]